MSNAQLRNLGEAEGAPAAPKETAPVMSETEAQELRSKLVDDAIQLIYERKGGLDIDLQIEVCRQAVNNALVCRQSEARALAENPDATRPKGDKPYVTLSEERLHMRDLSRYYQEAGALRTLARNLIEEAINRTRPRDIEEFKHCVENATRDLHGAGRVAACMMQRREPPPTQQLFVEAAAKLAPHVRKEHREQYRQACAQRDVNTIAELMMQQSNEVQVAFGELMRAAQMR